MSKDDRFVYPFTADESQVLKAEKVGNASTLFNVGYYLNVIEQLNNDYFSKYAKDDVDMEASQMLGKVLENAWLALRLGMPELSEEEIAAAATISAADLTGQDLTDEQAGAALKSAGLSKLDLPGIEPKKDKGNVQKEEVHYLHGYL